MDKSVHFSQNSLPTNNFFLYQPTIFHGTFQNENLLILEYLTSIEIFRISYFQTLNLKKAGDSGLCPRTLPGSLQYPTDPCTVNVLHTLSSYNLHTFFPIPLKRHVPKISGQCPGEGPILGHWEFFPKIGLHHFFQKSGLHHFFLNILT